MVTQLGLSPTSTLSDVKSVLQSAIQQEEATISGAQERLNYYQQQLASLVSLVALSEPTNGATNGALTTAETNGAGTAAAPTVESSVATTEPAAPKTPPKRTGGKSPTKSKDGKSTAKATRAKSTAKATDSQPQVQMQAEPAKAAPATSEVSSPAEPEVLANIPRPLKRFRGLSMPDALLLFFEEQLEERLTSKEITKGLYGASQLRDAAVEKKLVRIVSNNLTQGLKRQAWQKVGDEPALYQALPSVVEPVAIVEPVAN